MIIALQNSFAALTLATPAIWLLICGCLVLCSSLVMRQQTGASESRSAINVFAISTLLILGVAAALSIFRSTTVDSSSGLFQLDQTSRSCEHLILFGATLVVLIGWARAPLRFLPEYYGCLLLIVVGTMLVGGAADLVTLYLGLELVSIPTYVLLSIVKSDASGLEATMKYLLLSVFAAGFFLLGASYLYGLAGSTNLDSIQRALAGTGKLPILALVLVVFGLGFRITAVPFHAYAPDVFDGTSLTMSSALSYLPKVTGFVALIRILGGWPLNGMIGERAIPLLLVLAVASMFVGNLMGLAQSSLRRIFAYSSVAHSGYLLLALAALAGNGQEPSVIFSYLFAYAAMTLGAFACWSALEGQYQSIPGQSSLEWKRHPIRNLEDLKGQFARQPWVASLFIVCLLSLIGLPLTGGFWAKLQIFVASIYSDRWDVKSVAILMAMNSVLGAIYYWRIISKLIEKDPSVAATERPTSRFAFDRHMAPLAAGLIAAAITVFWFFAPSQM